MPLIVLQVYKMHLFADSVFVHASKLQEYIRAQAEQNPHFVWHIHSTYCPHITPPTQQKIRFFNICDRVRGNQAFVIEIN